MSRSQIMVAVRARAPRIANQTSGLSTCRNLNRDRGMTAWWGEVIDISYGDICILYVPTLRWMMEMPDWSK